MKNIILAGCLLLIFTACSNQHRYTQSSEEIEIVKAVISDYNYQEWESLTSHYHDTANIYFNSRSLILSPTDLEEYHKTHDAGFSTRAFEDGNREYEMIEDNSGKSWVNFWGILKGNLADNNKQVTIPVHITFQFIDKKRSEEHTSELQSRPHLVCRLLLEKKKKKKI